MNGKEADFSHPSYIKMRMVSEMDGITKASFCGRSIMFVGLRILLYYGNVRTSVHHQDVN